MGTTTAERQHTAVPRSHARVGYAAAATAFAFALVSFYWGAGGTAGLDTLGGTLEQDALARDPAIVALVWSTGVLKLAGGVLALALVRPWGRHFPRRAMAVAAWGGAALLTLYGVTQTGLVTFMWLGWYDTPQQQLSASELRWRMLLWEPWFLLWGVLLGLAAWQHRRRTRH